MATTKGGKPVLVERKRKKVRGSLLIVTRTLFHALSPVFKGQPGSLEKSVKGGIRVGYGGPGEHPQAPMSVTRLAQIHQKGNARLPARVIVVPPNAKVLKGMAKDTEKTLEKIRKLTNIK